MSVPRSATSLVDQSYALERAGDIAAAMQRAREALDVARACGEAAATADALVCLAYLHLRQGHYDRACTLAEEALTHAAPDVRARADALRILGDCAHEAGDLAVAEDCYLRAIDLGRQLGYPYILHRCLHSLSACVYMTRGQFQLALAADEESLHLAMDLGMTDEVWLPLATMGWTYWATGRRERALAVVEEMRRYVRPDSLAEGYYHCLCADLAQGGDDPQSALALYARARSIAECLRLGRRCPGHRCPRGMP